MGYATILGQRIVYSGGGYFRLAPYPLIRYCATRASYVMTYFHPRDFDPDQPVVPGLSAIRRFKSYYGLKSALSKLERFMSDFPFQELRSAVTTIKWEETAEFKFSK